MSLFAASILLVFSSGRWVVPLAAWLSPIVLLRFTRGGRPAPRLLAAAATLYGVGCWTWWGMVPVPGPGYFGIMVAIMLPSALPYAVDRLLGGRQGGFAATLLFPSAWVVTEWVVSRASPYGSWGAVAYTQADDLPLIQSVAVTGLWGIGFLIAWTASVANWAWARSFEWPRVRAGIVGWAATLALVLLFGGVRLALAPPTGPTLRVASLTVAPPARLSPWDLISRARSGPALDSLRTDLHAHEDVLFEGVRREAAAGARLVMWSEVNAFVLKDEEDAFRERAAAVAREARVHLVAGAAVFTPGQGFYENELMAFDSTGASLAGYHKARPVPGDPERGADRSIPVVGTSLGRIAGAVCFDADFPDLIRRAGRERADLLVIPASDWRAIDPLHTRMALFRGIENGCSVVRQTNKGLSAAADFQGRILATSDFFRSAPDVMVAQVPARGVPTPYAIVPDLLPLLCIGAIAAFAMGAVARRRQT